MAVFRVERTQNYTIMSNYHLRDKSISLKAKGLLSQMLSLPEDWDYTLTGLAKINQEGKDAIRAAVVELERAGYIYRCSCTSGRAVVCLAVIGKPDNGISGGGRHGGGKVNANNKRETKERTTKN